MDNDKINIILVIGYGSMGRRRIRILSELLPNATITCVDSNKDRLGQAKLDGYLTFNSIKEALEAKPDIAFVCTSPGHHADIIIELILAKIHVFTELNLTSERYDEIIEYAKKHKVNVFVSSTALYRRQMQIFKETIATQNIPITYSYHVGQYLPDWHPWESYKNFFIGKKETNGIKEILAIQLPWMINTFGKVKTIKVTSQKCTRLDIDFPDAVILGIEHECGNIGSFIVDVVSRKAMTHLEIIGESMHIVWDGHNDDLYQYNVETNMMDQIKVYKSDEHIDGYADNISEEPYREETKEFLRVIAGKDAQYGLEDDKYVLSIIDYIENQYVET